MPAGRIKLLSVLGGAACPALITYYLEHYRRFGVQEFVLSLHYDPGQEQARDAVVAHMRSVGIRPLSLCTGTFTEVTQKEQLEYLRQNFTDADDWLVYADIDEYHEFQIPLLPLRRVCERQGLKYVMGRWIDRVADNGELKPINPAADLYAQFPWATHLSMTLGGKAFDATTKLCFMASDVFPSNAGFHRPKDRNWREDPERWPGLIACNHFKWDESVRIRMKNRLRDWDIGNALKEANAVERHLLQNDGHINLAEIEPRQRQCDRTEWHRQALRFVRYAGYGVRSCLSRNTFAAQGGADQALSRWCGIYR